MISLKDKVALVVGASTHGGIGEAVAKRYARAGARVVTSARRLEGAREVAQAVSGTAIACDITDESQVERLIAETVAWQGNLDVVVIVAGTHANQIVDQMTRETLTRTFEMNVVGPMFVIKHAARAMKPGGSIVYVSSATAELNTVGVGAYGCTKAAGERLVEVAAFEYASRGLRLNTLQPGMVVTPMSEAALQRPGFKRAFERETPLGRLATVEDIAAAALWLASDDCYTTGDRVRVAGGVHLRRHPMPEDFRPD